MNSQNTVVVLRRGAIHCVRPMVLCRGRNKLRSYILLVTSMLSAASVTAQADALIDPTRPVFAPTKSSATVHSVEPVARVTAIFNSGERRVAVLDGQVVKAGDRIGDVVIQEILVDGVRFTRGGRVEMARLQKQAAPVRSDVRKSSITAGE